MKSSPQKVCIVGWDGATFDLIKGWVAQGRLPNIARVLSEGCHGALQSTEPPMTFPAWTSFLTGVNPGKHGIFDFMRQRPGTYDLEFVNGALRKAPTFWKRLSDAGRQVICLSVPCTFPPEQVQGIMISGFDAPGMGGADALVDARAIHPPELYEEITRELGGHPIGAFIVNDINEGHPEAGIEKMVDTVRRKAATAKYLMSNKPWDCFMILFGETDGVGHHYWKYCDPDSPLYVREPHLQESIFRVYEECDRQLGEILELLPADATLFIMSDHGFGGVSNWVLYPNCWLAERGLLKLRGNLSRGISRLIDAAKLRAVASLPVRVKRALYRLTRRRIGTIEAAARYSVIDWSGTAAYFDENPYYPFLWLNVAGRQPQGIVQPGRDYEETRTRLIAELQAWRNPTTGEPIVADVLRREDVYSGPSLEEAPDLVVKWGECRGYTYAFKMSAKSNDRQWIEAVDPTLPQNLAFFTGKSGSHREHGIFLAHGPLVRSGREITSARIMDIAPTLLSVCGLPVPADMDGRVLSEIFTADYVAHEPAVPDVATDNSAVAARQNGEYSDADAAIISDRLRALGYID